MSDNPYYNVADQLPHADPIPNGNRQLDNFFKEMEE